MCWSSRFPLQVSATSDLRFARDPVRRRVGQEQTRSRPSPQVLQDF